MALELSFVLELVTGMGYENRWKVSRSEAGKATESITLKNMNLIKSNRIT
jgi:hypothetical protein